MRTCGKVLKTKPMRDLFFIFFAGKGKEELSFGETRAPRVLGHKGQGQGLAIVPRTEMLGPGTSVASSAVLGPLLKLIPAKPPPT